MALDTTLVVTALGTATITGVVTATATLLTVRHQSAVNRETLEAERDRVRGERREKYRGDRQAAYHDLLDSTFTFALMGAGFREATKADFDAWYFDFEHRLHAVQLLGTDSVRGAVAKIDELLFECLLALKGDVEQRAYGEKLQACYSPRSQALGDAYEHVIELMRRDVLPAAELDVDHASVRVPLPHM